MNIISGVPSSIAYFVLFMAELTFGEYVKRRRDTNYIGHCQGQGQL